MSVQTPFGMPRGFEPDYYESTGRWALRCMRCHRSWRLPEDGRLSEANRTYLTEHAFSHNPVAHKRRKWVETEWDLVQGA